MSLCSEERRVLYKMHRIRIYVTVCIIISVISVLGVIVRYTGISKGQASHKEAEQECTCKESTECEGLRVLSSFNFPCFWKCLGTRRVCCPTGGYSIRMPISLSGQKCLEYQKMLCPVEDIIESTLLSSAEELEKHIPGKDSKGKEAYPDASDSYELIPEAFIRSRICLIFGGSITKPAKIPSMAMVGHGSADAIEWMCGGSLISETFVLTAAHCVNTSGLARWVRVGDLDTSSDSEEARPQQVEIVERIVHPGYRAPAIYNDIALLRLARPVVFDRFVRPGCLYPEMGDPARGVIAAGWGRNTPSGPRSSTLNQVDLKLVPGDECKKKFGIKENLLPRGIDTDGMVCAGEQGSGACKGDSGGPLFLPPDKSGQGQGCLATIVGVTSFGYKHCQGSSLPGVYVRVANFLPWIESLVWPM